MNEGLVWEDLLNPGMFSVYATKKTHSIKVSNDKTCSKLGEQHNSPQDKHCSALMNIL